MDKQERLAASSRINDEAIAKINKIKSSGMSEDEKLKKIDSILAISGGQMYKALNPDEESK